MAGKTGAPSLQSILSSGYRSLILFAVILASGTIIASSAIAMINHMERSLQLTARTVAYTVEPAIVFGDMAAVREGMASIATGDMVDRLVLVVEWEGRPAGRSFAVTSPIPRTLAFQRTSQAGTEVSVDGGRHWGRLDGLKLNDRNGPRTASPEDVTHLRWHVTPDEAEDGTGRITYSAIVR
ncbi:MAG: hypothetical protein EOP02_14680 [Proteobacteria bacterium]|nr:MAG: hypothetical protein EOP02_14680 [Pseudomonadota bacterium]